MLRTYKYLDTNHAKLHEFILAFFNHIEFENGDFEMSFFENDFRAIVNRHRKIIKRRCQTIYEKIRQPDWTQARRSALCEAIRNSNEIESICKGELKPKRIEELDDDIREDIRQLFLDLYNQVLNGDPFVEKYGKLRDHFDAFRKYNKNITLCPTCGIGELKTDADDTRDQYDHFLAKAIYPFSAVNFKNLVLVCKECNSLDVKADTDVITEPFSKLFYPYAEESPNINIEFSIKTDNEAFENIEWQVSLNAEDAEEEVASWNTIYKIESRYLGFIKGRIEKWYSHYWEYMYDDDTQDDDEEQRKKYYFRYMKKDEEKELNFIRRPALKAFLRDSVLIQAEYEAQLYSR